MKLFDICLISLALLPLIHGLPVDQESSALTGRFVQVTDFHMDPHYVPNSDVSTACHRPGTLNTAGKFGTLCSKCDSPPILVEEVFKFLKTLPKNDFVVYTGDSARHNRDKKELPRSYDEALETQSTIITHFTSTFDPSTKIVPVIGNNDVPKNTDCAEDDEAYQSIKKVWEPLQLNIEQDFDHGGYYAQDVIPKKLRILNTNTMLFSTKNKLNKDDCDVTDSAGSKHLSWLKSHLEDARTQKISVYISAHIPPNSKRDRVFYKAACYNGYYQLLGDYSDVIMGHFAGHFNNDVLTAVVEGPGLDQFDGKKQDTEDDSADNETQSAADDTSDHHGLDKRGHKHETLTTSQLNPPYGHIALLGHDMQIPSPIPKVHGVLFNAPSVIPLNNPAIRVYEYETVGDKAPIGTILTYKQYYADLQEANANGVLTFKLEYDAAELYGIERFDAQGVTHILETAASNPAKFSEFTRVMNPLPPPPEDD